MAAMDQAAKSSQEGMLMPNCRPTDRPIINRKMMMRNPAATTPDAK